MSLSLLTTSHDEVLQVLLELTALLAYNLLVLPRLH